MDMRNVYVLGVPVKASMFKSRGPGAVATGVRECWRRRASGLAYVGACAVATARARARLGAPSSRESLPAHRKCRRPPCTTPSPAVAAPWPGAHPRTASKAHGCPLLRLKSVFCLPFFAFFVPHPTSRLDF